MHIILYSKPGCHLCEGLQEKLEQVVETQDFAQLQLEIRDITTRDDWFQAYQYEIPVLFIADTRENQTKIIPRPSPRVSWQQLAQLLQKYI
ncbi:glutaredoxin family protein [Brunnivagina elsteri]|uniref:Thioredoxin family protein n=1 Tax=Brunnivagina elsteri CCALA 953 TaxID=987040 RepID=A0A2A2TL22_9CYAN|nr:glutaredoxin family protein [Calothrix elsteri]PAX57957.1 thioredoxin family protein [Calothrix elsteri CCALA 953]